MNRRRCDPMLLGGIPHNVVDPHQALHSFVVHHPPPFPQFDGHSRRPVGAIGFLPDVFDLFDQPPFGEFPNGGDTVAMTFPVVIRRPGHPSNVTDALYGELCGLLLVDEAVEHHSFDSLTQKATARFKSSRSIRNRAFSRSSSDSRSLSLLDTPSRSPRLT